MVNKNIVIGGDILRLKFADIKNFLIDDKLSKNIIYIETLSRTIGINTPTLKCRKFVYNKLLELKGNYPHVISIKNDDVNNESVADELLKYKELVDMGVLTPEEFVEVKSKLLNSL